VDDRIVELAHAVGRIEARVAALAESVTRIEGGISARNHFALKTVGAIVASLVAGMIGVKLGVK
jgi:hypothetical protein